CHVSPRAVTLIGARVSTSVWPRRAPDVIRYCHAPGSHRANRPGSLKAGAGSGAPMTPLPSTCRSSSPARLGEATCALDVATIAQTAHEVTAISMRAVRARSIAGANDTAAHASGTKADCVEADCFDADLAVMPPAAAARRRGSSSSYGGSARGG